MAQQKRIPLRTIPGATAAGVKWLMSAGVGNAAQGKAIAKVFIREFEKTKVEIKSASEAPARKTTGKR